WLVLTAPARRRLCAWWFRRRQTSSRLATFAEAFSSIAWAATTALAAAETWAALGTAAIAFGILAGVWLISPMRT
ncbi:MAG TPA: permease, partial [Pseudolabrys sp.]